MWEQTESRAYDGLTSLRSPFLQDGPPSQRLEATVALEVCDDFAGGMIRTWVYPSVHAPHDVFFVKVDGVNFRQFTQVGEGNTWIQVDINDLEPGNHKIEYEYIYNIASLSPEALGTPPPAREGKNLLIFSYLFSYYTYLMQHSSTSDLFIFFSQVVHGLI